MKSIGLWGAVALLAMSGFSAQASNLIRNGSFERPIVPAGTYRVFNTGDTFKNWTVVGPGGNVAIINQEFTYCGHTFPAKRGIQFVDLTGTSNTDGTGVQQTIDTVPSTTYSLSFFIGNIYDTSSNCGTTSTVNVVIDGVPVAGFTNRAGKGSTTIVWRKFSTDFVAQNATTTIALINGDPPADTANGLDGVVVAPAAP